MNSETLLLRQVHPNFLEDGRLSSQAFTPFPKDKDLLSVYDGDLISAKKAHAHYTEKLNFQSVGVWGVTCKEAEDNKLPSRSNPLENFDEHAVIDFTGKSSKTARKLAKKLRDLALTRGCLYASPEE